MNASYFLGANTKDGFYSLYESFAAREGDYLHIIKGGPGTGKSSFMRRLGAAAEQKGLDVQYVICSGDPDSLDGVYIPSMHIAWADGTAPHTLDARQFGVDSDYVNLGRFCKTPLSSSDARAATELTARYKAFYEKAYSYLKAAAAARKALPEPDVRTVQSVRRRVSALIGSRRSDAAGEKRLFLTSICCRGLVRLPFWQEYKRIYSVDDRLIGANVALSAAAETARERGRELIVCLEPLDPTRIEAVLLPEDSLAFVSEGLNADGARGLHIDSYLPGSLLKALRAEKREAFRLRESALASAYARLAEAKKLHDELEAIYKRYMDFDALNAYTTSVIADLF